MAKNPMTIDALQRMLQSSIEKVGGGKKEGGPTRDEIASQLPDNRPTGLEKAYLDLAQKQKRRGREKSPSQFQQRGLGGMLEDMDGWGDTPPTGLSQAFPQNLSLRDYWRSKDPEPVLDLEQAFIDQQNPYSSQNLDNFEKRQRRENLKRGSAEYAYFSEQWDDPDDFRYEQYTTGTDPYWQTDDVVDIDWEGMYRTGRRGARDAYDRGSTAFKKEARSAYEAEAKKRRAIATGDVKYLKSLYKPEGEARKRLVSGADKIATYGVKQLRESGAELGMATRGSQYMGLQKGALHGTLPQSTGALNGVMRGLAGLFVLFVFISVFYMVFGPVYDVLITNFLLIAGADGSTMLGGKDIAVLYANTANSILLWVPLLVIGGTLYLLISMVFERESKGLARTNEMLAWDALATSDDNVNLDMALEGGFEPMGDFYGPS
tara:strand:+ start:495 stop:1793 length:1299 start_codon:yes stop_codon:yes gene_type:complete